jgi:anti-anti-sigma factor
MEFSQKNVKGITVFSITGQIKISTQTQCKEYFDRHIGENCSKPAILNMSGVGYMNSAGIGMIVESFKKFRDNGGRLVICSLVPDIVKLFEITKLDHFIEVYPDEKTAIQKLTG